MTLHLSAEELAARHKEQQRAWRMAHPEKVKGYHNKHNAKPEVKERRKAWQNENKDKINARRRELYSQRNQPPEQSSSVAPTEPEV